MSSTADEPRLSRERRTSRTFRLFREKHAHLSVHYWTQAVAFKTLVKQLKGAPPGKNAVQVLGIDVREVEYGNDVHTCLGQLDRMLSTTRLHTLAICLAQLESFLKEITYLWALVHDPARSGTELSPVAHARIAPISEVDSLPRPLEYAEHLFELDFSENKSLLKKAYDYRCATVHNGGYVTHKARKRIAKGELTLNAPLEVNWPHLKKVLGAAYSVADLIDSKVTDAKLLNMECEVALHRASEFDELPPRRSVWRFLHKLGYRLPSGNAIRGQIESRIYGDQKKS